jgi:arylsulfatase
MSNILRMPNGLVLATCILALAACDIAPDRPVLAGQHHSPSEMPRPPASGPARPARPNILLIVADDLGYLDLGSYGGEISTPRLDELARSGIRFRNFRAEPTCALSRATLLTGTDNHLAGVGAQFNRGPQVGAPGYEGYLTRRVATLPEVLRAAGYHTYMAGKWHLGAEEDQSPAARGFESSFAMLLGAGSHFDLTPPGEEEGKVGLYREDGKLLDSLPPGFYSANAYTDKMLGYLKSHQGDGRPFFAYVAYTSPHWPLQAPDDYIDRYKGRYAAGYDALREARLARASALGSIPAGLDTAGYHSIAPPWESLTVGQKARESRMMEIYAAMVENMDTNVGRLLDYLRQSGQLGNTFIFFMSDNGADQLHFEDMPRNRDWVARTADNSLQNLGRKGSFASYGPGWASASMAPFHGFKGMVMDGGIRVAAIAAYPALAVRNVWSDSFLTVQDVAPSFIEMAGAQHPSSHDKSILPMRGKSFVSELEHKVGPTHAPGEAFGWEASGSRALIRDGWKAVRDRPVPPSTSARWQLFNLDDDPMELRDHAADLPARLDELVAAYEQYAHEVGVVPIEPQLRPGPPAASGAKR